jgi:hypothetical protein
MTQKIRTAARALQRGDVVGSGDVVVCVSIGVRTPRGKVEVTLERAGRSRLAVWGASTLIAVTRASAQGTLPGAEPIGRAEHAARLARAPLRPRQDQRPLDFGLFGDTASQLDLVDMARDRSRPR